MARRKKRRYYTDEEKANILRAIGDAVAGGTKLADAIKAQGIATVSYYEWRKMIEPAKVQSRSEEKRLAVLPGDTEKMLFLAKGHLSTMLDQRSELDRRIEWATDVINRANLANRANRK